ncbi:phenylacetate--CoA ligase family protein [Falsiroseomonas stagni]|uniref:Phenylacetate-CoA ligase n=1 Tax=Falsiroseomonas stagni DSM 19981 TaxID=1123062 RepID=A0A1I4ACH4_9PROT|nr:phenylacetate--CoA ligase family protein [Falsiroseomonas stagni]SFK54132.1 phenylacetate-CoA ligase [Falsiroseomonas stagni DSM 19981]
MSARVPPRYHEAIDLDALCQEFPPAPEFFDTVWTLPEEALRARREAAFLKQMERAWQVPFYRRRWSAAGLQPGDIRSLDDLKLIPTFSVHDMRESLERDPFWPDYFGVNPATDEALPLVFQTSGGTTGLPRPMMFAPRDREVMNIVTGRRLFMQGVRPFDRLQVTLSLGLPNGGLLVREGIQKYTGAVPIMTGSGAQTPTRRQIELMRAWGVTHLIGFPAYLRHMALVARDELGLDPRGFGIKGLITHLGVEDRGTLEELWGADVYDTYGMNEFGSVAVDCAEKSGMHVFEDCFAVEVLGLPDEHGTRRLAAEGEDGSAIVTTFFKHVAPMIRFDTNDITSFAPGRCACGSTHRRITGIRGRADGMVKLRGVNVFPEAIGALVAADPRGNGEFLCVLERGERMVVRVEMSDGSVAADVFAADLAGRFKEALSVRLEVEVVPKGTLAPLTGLDTTSKIRRLIDRRAVQEA